MLRMSQMLKSSGAMGAATLTSRFLGLLREIAYARFMGDGWVAGAFMLAFMIPNLFRRLLGEGALTAAFIPIFKEKEKLEGDAAMWRAANAVISGVLIGAVVIVVLGIVVVTIILMAGIKNGQTLLMFRLLRAMFPYVVLVCLAAIFMGMLNARGHFFIPAIGAAMLNVVMIASVFLIAPAMGKGLERQIFGLAIGVLLAGIVQAACQLPLLRREGFSYRWTTPWKDQTVRRVLRQMLPATLGVAAYQINVMFTQGIAFWVDPSVVASFNYAVRLMELPQGVFGLSLATYLLPTLSGLSAEKKYDEFRTTLGDGLGYLVFLNLLASVLLVILADPIIRLLFERGRFDVYSTERASQALIFLAPGLLAFSIVNILARAFYALGDTKTPMKVSIFCLGLNALFTFGLIFPLRQRGLGIANTLTSAVNVCLLGYALRKKIGRLEVRGLLQQVPGLLSAAVIAGALAWTIAWQWEHWIGHRRIWLKFGGVFLPAAAAALLYFGICWQLKVPYMHDIVRLLPGRFRRRIKVNA
jgi:putative peptidoglycan lipid II flippase